MGWWLLLLTAFLVGGGVLLFLVDAPGWAQLLWVLASGTAGGAVVMLIDYYGD